MPKGGSLPNKAWNARHHTIVALLWLHVPGVIIFGWGLGEDVGHLVFEVLPIASAAAIATYRPMRRTVRTVVTSIGLMTSSAVLVHLSGGVIEAHFHFFVMVGVVVLYQEWWPFLVAIGYVVLHHGVIGTLFPQDVYNHPAAVTGPWKWAAVHGAFILAMSVAGVLAWRLNESLRSTTAVREQQMAEAQQLAHVGSWEWDLTTDALEFSDEMYRIFGMTPADQAPSLDEFMERVDPEDRPAIREVLAEARETCSDFAVDFRFTTPTGELRWMHGRGETVADEKGTASRMRGTGHDITERKQMQAALAREAVVLRGLLQTVATTANEATTVDAAMDVAIEQVCALTGWPIGHAFLAGGRGEPLSSAGAWHLEDPERFEGFRQATETSPIPYGSGVAGQVLSSGAPAWVTDVTTDPNFTRRDAARECGIRSAFAFPLSVGREIVAVLEFFSTRAEPDDQELLEVIGQLGKQLGLVIERAQATEKLRASNERNRTIVETASDAFVEMDERGIIVDWNRRAESMFGWSREEVIGRELATVVIPEELREAHRQGLARYLSTGVGPVVSGRIEVTALHRAGVQFPVELAVWEVESGTSRFFDAFVRDITLQKQTEEALASARDQAVEASHLKSEFLANMSHEIRTPMNGVIGLTSLILDTPLDEAQRKYAEGVQSASEALLAVINDILDFSKVEAGKVELEEIDFNLRDLVEESVALFAGPAAMKNLELASWCYPSLPAAVRGDPVRLRQVLLNLVGNAMKFTERGQVVVQVRPLELNATSVIVRFEVIDTGIGIDAGSYDRLFASFSQADSSTTRRYGGSGLGLALVKRLVDLWGGEVGVDSEPGKGSTFWFTVPLATAAVGDPDPATRPCLEGVRALIVDDNASNGLILEQQLTVWGMRPEAMQDPRQALGVLRRAGEAGEPYGVALLDMQMPVMNGVQVAKAVRCDAAFGDLPIILLSSAGALGAREASLSGISASLMKPVRQAELCDALTRVLTPRSEHHVPAQDEDVGPTSAERWRGHVLVVEDNPINQTVASGTLAKLGYRTDVVANGREAVEAVSRSDYAAVLMDCQMPEMDGYQATREIRQREGAERRVPIIAMTASAMEADRDRCLAAGMDDFVPKPVRRAEMEAALERWTGTGAEHGSDGPAWTAPQSDPGQHRSAT